MLLRNVDVQKEQADLDCALAVLEKSLVDKVLRTTLCGESSSGFSSGWEAEKAQFIEELGNLKTILNLAESGDAPLAANTIKTEVQTVSALEIEQKLCEGYLRGLKQRLGEVEPTDSSVVERLNLLCSVIEGKPESASFRDMMLKRFSENMSGV